MRAPPAMLNANGGGLVTAGTELADGRLVMMMDVESILDQTLNGEATAVPESFSEIPPPGRTILFADDSAVARKQIARTLDDVPPTLRLDRQRVPVHRGFAGGLLGGSEGMV